MGKGVDWMWGMDGWNDGFEIPNSAVYMKDRAKSMGWFLIF